MRFARLALALGLLLGVSASATTETVKILVQSSPLAGSQFYAVAEVWPQIRLGDRLTLIRVQTFFWDKTARYSIVAARMPECQRRHELGSAGSESKVEVYAPGNDAWILKQGKRLFVVETRTCEGFAKLEGDPEGGMGPLQGSFQMRNGTLTFVTAAQGETANHAAAPAAQ